MRRKHMIKFLSMIMAAAMVVTSVDLPVLAATQPDVAEEAVVDATLESAVANEDEVVDTISEDDIDSADVSLEDEESDEAEIDEMEADGDLSDDIPDETEIDITDLWAEKNQQIIVTSQGYCIGGSIPGYYSDTNEYTPFKKLVLTGEQSFGGNYLYVKDVPEGASLCFKDLDISTDFTTSAVKIAGGTFDIEWLGRVRLNSGYAAMNIENANVTITGSGDIYYRTQQGGGRFVDLSNASLKTRNYTGDIAMYSTGNSGIISGSGSNSSVSLETTGAIKIAGGVGNNALSSINTVNLKAESIECRQQNGGSFIGNVSYATLKADKDIVFIREHRAPMLSVNKDLTVEAGGDIIMNDTAKTKAPGYSFYAPNYISGGKSNFKAGGSILYKPTEQLDGLSSTFVTGSAVSFEAGKNIDLQVKGNMISNCTYKDFKAGENITLSSDESSTALFSGASLNVNAKKDITIRRTCESNTSGASAMIDSASLDMHADGKLSVLDEIDKCTNSLLYVSGPALNLYGKEGLDLETKGTGPIINASNASGEVRTEKGITLESNTQAGVMVQVGDVAFVAKEDITIKGNQKNAPMISANKKITFDTPQNVSVTNAVAVKSIPMTSGLIEIKNAKAVTFEGSCDEAPLVASALDVDISGPLKISNKGKYFASYGDLNVKHAASVDVSSETSTVGALYVESDGVIHADGDITVKGGKMGVTGPSGSSTGADAFIMESKNGSILIESDGEGPTMSGNYELNAKEKVTVINTNTSESASVKLLTGVATVTAPTANFQLENGASQCKTGFSSAKAQTGVFRSVDACAISASAEPGIISSKNDIALVCADADDADFTWELVPLVDGDPVNAPRRVMVKAIDKAESDPDNVYLIGNAIVPVVQDGFLAEVYKDGNDDPQKFNGMYGAITYAIRVSSKDHPATIKLLEDVSLASSCVFTGGYIKLDLAGHTIDLSEGAYTYVQVGDWKGKKEMSLTVCDSSEEQDGAIINDTPSVFVVYSGNLIIESGNFKNASSMSRVIQDETVGYKTAANIQIKGGRFNGQILITTASVDISGGTFTGNAQSAILISSETPDVKISGGTFIPGSGDRAFVWNNDARYRFVSLLDEGYGLKSVGADTFYSKAQYDDIDRATYIDESVSIGKRTALSESDFGQITGVYELGNPIHILRDNLDSYNEALTEDDYYIGDFHCPTEACEADYYNPDAPYVEFVGQGAYYGTIRRSFTTIDPIVYPDDTMSVSRSVATAADAILPDGWEWMNPDEELELGESKVLHARYTLNVVNVNNSKLNDCEITVTREDCEHIESEILYGEMGEYPATCEYNGLGHIECIKCHKLLRVVKEPALMHDYSSAVFTWSNVDDVDAASASAFISCTRCGLGNSYGAAVTHEKSDEGFILYKAQVTVSGVTYHDELAVYPDGLQVKLLQHEFTFTGKEIKPEVYVAHDGEELVAGKDYTITYKNNTKANRTIDGEVLMQGKDKKKRAYELVPTVTVKGKGNYAGSVSMTFNIYQMNVRDAVLEMAGDYFNPPAKDKSIKVIKSFTTDGKTKIASGDQVVSYVKAEDGSAASLKNIKPGDYTMIIEGKNDLYGSISKDFTVTKDILLSSAKVTLDSNYKVTKVVIGKKTYSGTALDDNFEIQYPSESKATLRGDHQIVISGKEGKGFVQTKIVTYTVAPISLDDSWFKLDKDSFNYNGDEHNAGVVLTEAAPEEFEQYIDYTVSYKNNTKAGKASAIITGINDYKGTVTLNYTINKINLTSTQVAVNYSAAVQNRAGAKPSDLDITFTDNGQVYHLVAGKDYKVTYADNTKTGENVAKMTIEGTGSCKGKLVKKFSIVKKAITSSDITMSVSDVAYTKDKAYKQAVTVYDNGKKLKKGTDFELIYCDQATKVLGEDIVEKGYVTLSVMVKGLGDYADENASRTLTYRVCAEKLSSLKIELADGPYVYEKGAEIRPKVNVYYGIRVGLKTCWYKLSATEYNLAYANNTNVGKATVTVKGIKKYAGSKKLTFKIVAHNFGK